MGDLLLGEPEGPVTGVHSGPAQGRQRIRVARDVRSGDDAQAPAVAGKRLGVEPDLDPAQAAAERVPRVPGGRLDPQPPLRLVENEVGTEQIDPDVVDAVVVEQAEQERPALEEGLDVFGRPLPETAARPGPRRKPPRPPASGSPPPRGRAAGATGGTRRLRSGLSVQVTARRLPPSSAVWVQCSSHAGASGARPARSPPAGAGELRVPPGPPSPRCSAPRRRRPAR